MIGTIDVRDLVGRPGVWRSEQVSGTIDDLATELAGLPADTPVTADLILESLEEGILASGKLQGVLSMRCARCLKGFEQELTVEIRELFVPFPHEDSDEYPLEPDGFLDPDQMFRDAVGVELPFAPICRPDCRGLCGRCGGDLNLEGCTLHRARDRSPLGRTRGAVRTMEPRGERTRAGTQDRTQERDDQMAVPKKKQSKTRGDKRAANWKAKPPPYSECPQCHQPKLPHRVCGNCGYYAGRQAVEVE